MKQTWPPQPAEPEGPASAWQRLEWCHTSWQFTWPLAFIALVFLGIGWSVTPGLDHRATILGVAAIAPALLVIVAAVPPWRSWREAALGRNGAPAQGDAIRIRTHRGSTRLVTVYLVDYQFRDATGRTFDGHLRSTRPILWEFYRGEPLAVRYDPARPARNTLRDI